MSEAVAMEIGMRSFNKRMAGVGSFMTSSFMVSESVLWPLIRVKGFSEPPRRDYAQRLPATLKMAI